MQIDQSKVFEHGWVQISISFIFFYIDLLYIAVKLGFIVELQLYLQFFESHSIVVPFLFLLYLFIIYFFIWILSKQSHLSFAFFPLLQINHLRYKS